MPPLLFVCVAAAPAAVAAADLPRYFVTLDAANERAGVTVCLDRAHAHLAFAPDSRAGLRYLHDVRRTTSSPLDTSRFPWRADHWRAGECLAYTADVGALADEHSDAGSRIGANLVTDPQHWLVRADAQGAAGAEAGVALPDGWSISAPWSETGRAGNVVRFHVPDTPSDWSASLAFGPRIDQQRIELAGGTLQVALLFAPEPAQHEKLLAWMREVGAALTTAYGRMPVPEAQVTIVSVDDTQPVFRFAAFLQPSAVLAGESARGQGNGLQLVVDPRRPAQEFADDWTAVHELSHLLHPYLGDRGSWLAEGLATYYQNVLRARVGLLSEQQAWERLAAGFRRGAGSASGRTLADAAAGMEKSHEFTRVYWAGAAYWLTVDSDLRRASGGALNLDVALARFSGCCLPSSREWRPEEFVAKLDALAGVKTFSTQYHAFAAMRGFPDWEPLLERIGVRVVGDTVMLADGTADAGLGQRIMSRDRACSETPRSRVCP